MNMVSMMIYIVTFHFIFLIMKITTLKCKNSQGWFIYQQLPDITLLINVHNMVLDSAFLQSCVSYLEYICYFVFIIIVVFYISN